MKTPEELAEEYANSTDSCDVDQEYVFAYKGFLAGYRAAKAIVEEELQAVQAQRAEYPGLGAAQYALKNVLAKMGSK